MRLIQRAKYIAQSADDEMLLRSLLVGLRLHPTDYELIYEGRNKIYRVRTERGFYVVKCFGYLGWLRRVYYGWFCRGKAICSYENARALARRGFATADPLGCAEYRDARGLLVESYFVTQDIHADEPHIQPHIRGWATPEGLLEGLGGFLAQLHASGIEHLDLSPGNILYRRHSDGYTFYLVDLNRMRLHDTPLDLKVSVKNIARLTIATSVTQRIAHSYAKARGWDPQETAKLWHEETDRFWRRRLFKLSARYVRGNYGHSYLDFTCHYLLYRIVRLLRKVCPSSISAWTKLRGYEENLYSYWLRDEDIRHALLRREGYGYTLVDHHLN